MVPEENGRTGAEQSSQTVLSTPNLKILPCWLWLCWGEGGHRCVCPLQVSAHRAVLDSKVTSPPKGSQIPCISCLAELARLSLERGLWLGPGRAGAGEAPCPQCQLPAPLQVLPRVQVTVLFAELRAIEESSLHNEYSERRDSLG